MKPAAVGVGSINNQYLTLNHELFHVMSYLCYVDRPDDTYSAFQDSFNGPFWERCAVHASLTVYPNSTNEFERYMYAPHSHFLNTRKHYSVSFFLENLDATFGYSSMGDLWKNRSEARRGGKEGRL